MIVPDDVYDSWKCLPQVATNYDHSWEPEIAEELERYPNAAYAHYAGGDFYGYVWHDGTEFHCQVWQYKIPREIVSASDIPGIMQQASAKYGSK